MNLWSSSGNYQQCSLSWWTCAIVHLLGWSCWASHFLLIIYLPVLFLFFISGYVVFRGRQPGVYSSASLRSMVSPTTATEGTRLERRQRRSSTYLWLMRLWLSKLWLFKHSLLKVWLFKLCLFKVYVCKPWIFKLWMLSNASSSYSYWSNASTWRAQV
jgi:hypothetical protein